MNQLPTHPLINHSKQLLVVTASDMFVTQATLTMCYRDDCQHSFKQYKADIPVVLGKNGLAWDSDFVSDNPQLSSIKQEGDNRSPAGVFTLGSAFGSATHIDSKLAYQQMTHNMLCVDDENSKFYNKIIDSSQHHNPDWQSAEQMQAYSNDLYRLGIWINYNKSCQANLGSCILLHVWRGELETTRGCTAMAEENLLMLLQWLDPAAIPLLVQMPELCFARNCLNQQYTL